MGINNHLFLQLIRDFPDITNVVFDGTYMAQKRWNEAQTFYFWVSNYVVVVSANIGQINST